MRKLAIAYGIGRGSNLPDNEKPISLIAAAAQGGDGEAELIYGNYLTRSGHPEEGEGLMLKAAAKGVRDAHVVLGDHYYYEKSPLFDYKKAFYHYDIAARAGDTHSQVNLSYMYCFGDSPATDGAAAWMWLLIADGTQLDVLRARYFAKPQLTPAEIVDAEARQRSGLISQPIAID
jgi:TPR repeat protein